MGESWVSVREGIAAGTLRPADKGLSDVVARWDALLQFASLELGRDLGQEVSPILSRREATDPGLRAQNLREQLTGTGTLTGAIKIPHAAGPIVVTADLRAGQVTCRIDIAAPQEGRPATRVKWLTRQLDGARDAVRVEAFLAHSRGPGAAELLGQVKENPALLIQDPKRELKTFRLATNIKMGSKRGRGRGSFIDSVLEVVNEFYREVVQHLKVWQAAPPKMRELPPADVEATPLSSTALSSQDGPQEPAVAPTSHGATVVSGEHMG